MGLKKASATKRKLKWEAGERGGEERKRGKRKRGERKGSAVWLTKIYAKPTKTSKVLKKNLPTTK